MDRDLTSRKTQGAPRAEEEESGDTDSVSPDRPRVACSVHLGPGLVMFKERPSSWAQQKTDPRGLVKEKPSLTWELPGRGLSP